MVKGCDGEGCDGEGCDGEGCDGEGCDGFHGGMHGRLGMGPDRVGAPPMIAMPKCDEKGSITSVIKPFGKSTYILPIEVAITILSSMHHDMAKPPKRYLYMFLFEEGDTGRP